MVYLCIPVVVAGVCRERDELVALLNIRDRHCFETLSSIGRNDADVVHNSKCRRSHGTEHFDVTAVKVSLICWRQFSVFVPFLPLIKLSGK